jgi:hypothetical protein
MSTIRRILRPVVILALIAWTFLVLLLQTFKGSSAGGFGCLHDPTCGEIGWIPTAAWIGGLIFILAVAWAKRRR